MGFKRFDPQDFLVSADAVSSTVWSGNSPELNNFYYSTAQFQTAGDYYLSIYQTASSNPSAEVQFDIAYGHVKGSGSLYYNTSVPGVSPASTIYGQYRSLILEDENSQFSFGNVTQEYFYVINVSRARYKEKLLPGSLNLVLTSGSNTLHLTDNSQNVTLPAYYGTQRAYQIVSGSNGSAYNISTGGTGYTTASGSYGLFLPDTSIILLNGKALDLAGGAGGGINLNTNLTPNTNGQNTLKLYRALVSGSSFELNSEETITSDFVFVRARNAEFNYSENPSFISGSTGEVIYPYFINNPQVYPTTVGLYNDANELLAVAKLSRPLQKNFTKEALVRVKLDF